MNKIEIKHQLINEDFFIPNWEVKHLFLGTFNPEGGAKVKYFYGRSRNRTWDILSEIFKKDLNPNNQDFIKTIESLGIACMDIIRIVRINESEKQYVLGKGYSDSKIINNKTEREYNTDNILKLINNNYGINLYSTWGNGPILSDWKNEISKISEACKIKSLVSPSMVARVPVGTEKFKFMLKNWSKSIIL